MISEIFIVIQICMVIGPVSGYLDQIYRIRKAKSSEGFSLDTCGVLIVSSIIRIFFWILKPFDTVLLYQSILMIAVQLFLLYDCVHYRYPIAPAPNRRWFWNWYTYRSYIAFLMGFTGVLALICLPLAKHEWFRQTLGAMALGIEATVPMPQAWQNFRLQSVIGFSPWILLMWFFGDGFKTFYYVAQKVPLQFILCGIVQLTIDSVIVLQFVFYHPRLRELFGLDAEYERHQRTVAYNSLDDLI